MQQQNIEQDIVGGGNFETNSTCDVSRGCASTSARGRGFDRDYGDNLYFVLSGVKPEVRRTMLSASLMEKEMGSLVTEVLGEPATCCILNILPQHRKGNPIWSPCILTRKGKLP
jgi:hypothetical protein